MDGRPGERRRRGTAAAAGAALATVLVVLGSYYAFVARRSAPPTSSSALPHEERWDDIAFQVPSSWRVQDAGAGLRRYRAGSFVEGPFVATVETGPICRTTSGGYHCARADGIVTKPADGMIGWFSAAPLGQGGDVDPGYEPVERVCDPGTAVFHAYRVLQGASGARALTVDACLYGTHHDEDSSLLQGLLASARLTS